jgi:ABC-type nitrate/sulfonate/bicarbonate transport system substrate-binding protein
MKRQQAISTVLGGAALLGGRPLGASAADAVPLRIALLPVDPAACAYYAKDLGYFNDAGIAADIQVIQSGSAVVAAVVAGSLDIGWSNPISVAAAHLRGIPIVAIAAGGVYVAHDPTAAIVVPKNSQLKIAKDFNGTTMACSGLKTVGQWGPAAWIDKNGGDSSTMKFVEMPFPEMPQALAQNRVDSAFSAEPFITMGKDSSRVFVDALVAVAPRFSFGVWVATRQWAETHRDIISKFTQVMSRTAAWANTHHDASAAILAEFGKIDPAVAKAMKRITYATRLENSDIQPVLDLATHYGTLPSIVPADQIVFKP